MIKIEEEKTNDNNNKIIMIARGLEIGLRRPSVRGLWGGRPSLRGVWGGRPLLEIPRPPRSQSRDPPRTSPEEIIMTIIIVMIMMIMIIVMIMMITIIIIVITIIIPNQITYSLSSAIRKIQIVFSLHNTPI